MIFTRTAEHMRLLERYADRCKTRGGYSPAFVGVAEQGSAWSREVRVVMAAAAAHHLRLDEELLTLSDVRDLQALRAALSARLRRSRGASAGAMVSHER
jgi:hypothetical protein